MPSLIRGDGDGVGIFLDRGIDHFFNTAVMPQVNYLNACGLYDSSHDIDSRIVPVKQRGCGYNSDLVCMG